jgi:hypothetical protein
MTGLSTLANFFFIVSTSFPVIAYEADTLTHSIISFAAIENVCACLRTGIRKDGDCLVMEDERVDPIPADYAMPGAQGRSKFIENIAQQDSAATRTPLHRLLLP